VAGEPRPEAARRLLAGLDRALGTPGPSDV